MKKMGDTSVGASKLESQYTIQNDPILSPKKMQIIARVEQVLDEDNASKTVIVPAIILKIPGTGSGTGGKKERFEVETLFRETGIPTQKMDLDDFFFSLDTFVAGWANMGITPLLKEALENPEMGDMILLPEIRTKLEKALRSLLPDEMFEFFSNLLPIKKE